MVCAGICNSESLLFSISYRLFIILARIVPPVFYQPIDFIKSKSPLKIPKVEFSSWIALTHNALYSCFAKQQ